MTPLAVACLVCAETFACPCSDIPRPDAHAPKLDRIAGIRFLQSPTYKEEFDQAVAGAYKACRKHKGEAAVAIVSDIDETLLDNRQIFEQSPNYSSQQFRQWIAESQAPRLKKTADFVSWARQQRFAVFLITGRNESERRPTIENLVKDGIAYDGLYMRGNEDKRPAWEVKRDYRQAIERLGFKIIVNMGDQYSDLYGGHAEDCEKLPNRIYYIP